MIFLFPIILYISKIIYSFLINQVRKYIIIQKKIIQLLFSVFCLFYFYSNGGDDDVDVDVDVDFVIDFHSLIKYFLFLDNKF